MEEEDKSFRSDFMKTMSKKLFRCHNPIEKCQLPSIRAHSIQNGKVIDLLHRKGKVSMMAHKLRKDGPAIELGLKGRNEASTFTGLCAKHDTALFDPIDNYPITISNKEQMFLCAYRSILRELHVIMEGASQAQDVLIAAIDRGVETKKCNGPIGIRATSQMIYAYKFYLYKFHEYDTVYRSKDYDKLAFDNFYIDHTAPTLAVSAVYSMLPFTSFQYAPIVFNIFPINKGRSVVSFCYSRQHVGLCRAALDKVLGSTGEYQKYELSRLTIAHTENFILSPEFVERWDKCKTSIIEEAYRKTIGQQTEIGEAKDFMLFESAP